MRVGVERRRLSSAVAVSLVCIGWQTHAQSLVEEIPTRFQQEASPRAFRLQSSTVAAGSPTQASALFSTGTLSWNPWENLMDRWNVQVSLGASLFFETDDQSRRNRFFPAMEAMAGAQYRLSNWFFVEAAGGPFLQVKVPSANESFWGTAVSAGLGVYSPWRFLALSQFVIGGVFVATSPKNLWIFRAGIETDFGGL